MKPSIVRDTKSHAVTQSIEIIRSRIDTLGVSEPVIEEHGLGENQILVQLPGVDDPSRVKDIITKTGMLEIKQASATTLIRPSKRRKPPPVDWATRWCCPAAALAARAPADITLSRALQWSRAAMCAMPPLELTLQDGQR